MSRRALAAMALSFGAPVAVLHPILWLVPALATAVSISALKQIARENDRLVGRTAALFGLGFALFCGVGAATRYATHRAMVRSEAVEFAATWFEHLRNDEPHRAHQMCIEPNRRFPLDEENLWDAYRSLPNAADELRQNVAQPLVRTLLALGPRATARLYEIEGIASQGPADGVTLVYAVTYSEDSRTKTFFIRVMALRDAKPDVQQSPWRIAKTEGGFVPENWQKPPMPEGSLR